MQIKESILSNVVIGLILTLFVFLTFVITADRRVYSQKEETVREESRADSVQEKQKKADRYQEFFDLLSREESNEAAEDKEILRARKINAIKQLGGADLEKAIPLLIKYLDFEDAGVPYNGIPITAANFDEIFQAEQRYPAIVSLARFGHVALPALADVVRRTPWPEVRRDSAMKAIKYIFLRNDLSGGESYLEKAAATSKTQTGSQSLLSAARELRKLWEASISDPSQEMQMEGDEYEEFFDLLSREENNKEDNQILFVKKLDAIERIGRADPKRAIPVLIKYLDFEDVRVNERGRGINITEYDDVYLSMRYPAIDPLWGFGRKALPGLLEVLKVEPSDSIRSNNAVEIIVTIFAREDLADAVDGVLFLDKAASETKSENEREALLNALRKLRQIVERRN